MNASKLHRHYLRAYAATDECASEIVSEIKTMADWEKDVKKSQRPVIV